MKNDLAPYIELNQLGPAITISELEALCNDAIRHQVAAICIPPILVKKAKEILKESNINIATVVGFPFGYSAVEAKLAEVVMALIDGADEINLLINITALKNKDWQYLAKELNAIMPVVRSKGLVLKINIEAGLLTNEEIMQCCDLYGIAGVEFIETSTGFANAEATIEMVQQIRKHLAEAVKIKATINSNDRTFASSLMAAGADRVGCTDGSLLE